MSDFRDKFFLFFFCLTLYLLCPQFGLFVSPALIAVIFICFTGYWENARIRAVLTVGALACCFYFPGLTVFLPVICYDLITGPYQLLVLFAAIPYYRLYATLPAPLFAAELMLFAVGALFRHRTLTHQKLIRDFNELRDTAREMSLTLERQNRDLLEKQDGEVRIATLNERNRIAREIHDNVGHLLSSTILQVGALLAVNRDEGIHDNLLAVKDTLDQAMDSIRSSVHNLHEESIDLRTQVLELVQKFRFCPVEYDYGIRGNPDKKVKYAFISIVKEALSNVIRHSNATRVTISFREHPALYQLIITDNGTPEQFSMENGIGLKNISDRVGALNGNCNITAENGFQIFISIPKTEDGG